MSENFEIPAENQPKNDVPEEALSDSQDSPESINTKPLQEILDRFEGEQPIDLEISDEDRGKYFFCTVEDKSYSDTVKMFDGKMEVHCRDRTIEELDNVMAKLSSEDIKLAVDYDAKTQLYNLAYSLVQVSYKKADGTPIRSTGYDSGTLEERVKRIKEIPNNKYILLASCMVALDRKVYRLKKEAMQENF